MRVSAALLLVVLLLAIKAVAAIPTDLECAWRRAALQHGKALQPHMSDANQAALLESLNSSFFGNGGTNTSGCFPPAPPPPGRGFMQPAFASPVTAAAAAAASKTLHVSAGTDCDDTGVGSQSKPFCTIAHAVVACRGHGSGRCAVLLGSGIHRLNETIQLGAADSRLMIVGAAAGGSVISGSTPITSHWDKVKTLGGNLTLWKTALLAHAPSTIDTLLVDGIRAIQARFPNADPELDKFPIGYVLKGGQWLPPKEMGEPTYIEYPQINRTSFRSLFKDFRGGVGGQCGHFTPPYSYWCAETTQGGGAHKSGQGGEYEVPGGLTFTQEQLPHAPYSSVQGALVTAWRPGHWSTWGFLVGGGNTTASTTRGKSTAGDKPQITQTLLFDKGGFQGARGNQHGAEWFISNVPEELDAEREFWYNASSAELFFVATDDQPPSSSSFQHALLKVLFNVSGTQAVPVVDVTFAGLGFTGTATTFLEPHGVPVSTLALDDCGNAVGEMIPINDST